MRQYFLTDKISTSDTAHVHLIIYVMCNAAISGLAFSGEAVGCGSWEAVCWLLKAMGRMPLARPPVAEKRLSLTRNGMVRYEVNTPPAFSRWSIHALS